MERKAVFAGSWYPDSPRGLDAIIGFQGHGGSYRHAILPHAGLYYSGALIKSFFSGLDERIGRILIIAPSHYHRIKSDVFTVSSFTSSETPYGSIVTVPFAPNPCVVDDRAVADEHAVEMFLPFIKKHGGLDVSYALVNHVSGYDAIVRLSDILSSHVDEETSVIASSDFTHYGRRFGYEPYGSGALERVRDEDMKCAGLLASGRTEEAYDMYSDKTICGLVPALLVSRMAVLKGLEGMIGPYATSAGRDGGRNDFVSYCDVFWR